MRAVNLFRERAHAEDVRRGLGPVDPGEDEGLLRLQVHVLETLQRILGKAEAAAVLFERPDDVVDLGRPSRRFHENVRHGQGSLEKRVDAGEG